MHKPGYSASMRNEDWSAARVSAALSRLEDAGRSQPEMARAAGVSQSTVNRWARGKVRPGYDAVRKLAVTAWPRHPDLARELVEASGYAWAEPKDVPPPDPIPPEVLRVIERADRDEQWKRDAIEALEAIERERRAGEQGGQLHDGPQRDGLNWRAG